MKWIAKQVKYSKKEEKKPTKNVLSFFSIIFATLAIQKVSSHE